MSDAERLVLCIDDDTTTLTSLSDALKERYKVILAMTPDAGINLAIKRQPDLILLDIDMPGISGIEVAQMLRREPKTQTIPIIFLSAYDTELEKRRAEEVAAADFLAKPCSFKEVHKAVESVLLTAN